MKNVRRGLIFLCLISYGSSGKPMSKMREFMRELYRNGQIRMLLIPSPDESNIKKFKSIFFMQKDTDHFFSLLEREFLRVHLEIDRDDSAGEN